MTSDWLSDEERIDFEAHDRIRAAGLIQIGGARLRWQLEGLAKEGVDALEFVVGQGAPPCNSR